jgi:hypothetical protein
MRNNTTGNNDDCISNNTTGNNDHGD